MNRSTPYTRREKLTLLILALSAAILAALAMVGYHGRSHRWVRLVSPPNETVTELIAVNRVVMPYVKTAQGNLYFCSGSSWRDKCVPITPAELPINEVHPKWLTCPPPFPQTPPAPGEIVDAIEVGQCAEARTYSKVILLRDGALWQWRRTYSWVEPFTVWTAAMLGLGLGWALGGLVINTRRYLRSPLPGSVI